MQVVFVSTGQWDRPYWTEESNSLVEVDPELVVLEICETVKHKSE